MGAGRIHPNLPCCCCCCCCFCQISAGRPIVKYYILDSWGAFFGGWFPHHVWPSISYPYCGWTHISFFNSIFGTPQPKMSNPRGTVTLHFFQPHHYYYSSYSYSFKMKRSNKPEKVRDYSCSKTSISQFIQHWMMVFIISSSYPMINETTPLSFLCFTTATDLPWPGKLQFPAHTSGDVGSPFPFFTKNRHIDRSWTRVPHLSSCFQHTGQDGLTSENLVPADWLNGKDWELLTVVSVLFFLLSYGGQ